MFGGRLPDPKALEWERIMQARQRVREWVNEMLESEGCLVSYSKDFASEEDRERAIIQFTSGNRRVLELRNGSERFSLLVWINKEQEPT